MIISIVNALYNEELKVIEVVKEFDNGVDSVMYGLHVMPKGAINSIAAIENVDDPDDAITLALYNPHVHTSDLGSSALDRAKNAKNRTHQDGRSAKALKDNLILAGIPDRYHPMDGMDPVELIRAYGKVTTENIQQVRNLMKGQENEHTTNIGPRTEPSRSEVGRSEPRRAYISLGSSD